MFMKKTLFTSAATSQAFEAWVKSNPNYHPYDDQRFYDFIQAYYENKEGKTINEEDFVEQACLISSAPDAEEMLLNYCKKANAILGYLHYFEVK